MVRGILIAVAALVGLVVALGVGGYLALRRPDIDMATLEGRYKAGDSQWVELEGGVRMHYRMQGPDAIATILLIHGYGASTATWDQWTERLADRHRMVRIDLPGHGLTTAPADFNPSPDAYADLVDAFAAKLGLGPVVVVGSSMGGNVAWRVASRHPQRVSALVLVDAAGWPDPARAGGSTALFSMLQSPFWSAILRDLDTTALVRQTLRASFIDQTLIDEAMVRRYVELSRAPGHRAMLQQIMRDFSTVTPPSAETLGQIVAPTLVLHGAQDAIVPVSAGQAYAAAIPGAKLVIYDGVGHLPQEEMPDRSAQDVMNFLAVLPPFSPLGQPLELPTSPNAEGRPLGGPGPAEPGKPLEGVY